MGRLRDSEISNAKPKAAPYKLADGMGLYLYVAPKNARHPKGAKPWRYDYRIAGRRETLTIGKSQTCRWRARGDVTARHANW